MPLFSPRDKAELTYEEYSDTSPEYLIIKLYNEMLSCKLIILKHGPVYVRPSNKHSLVFDPRKYYDYAINYQKVILLALENKLIPHFMISLSDLSESLKNELDRLDIIRLQRVLRAATLKIFQDIDDKYNNVFPEDDLDNRINLCKEIDRILRVKLVK